MSSKDNGLVEANVPLVPPRLTVLCGPTAVGKDTVITELCQKYPGQFHLSISATTRSPRPGEVDGESYYFITPTEFQKLIDQGQMLEWAIVHGTNYYGTPKAPVLESLQAGRPVLLQIDLAGCRQVRKSFPAAQTVFLAPPSWEVLVDRLTGRGTETPAEQQRRLETARQEMAAQNEFDHIIINDNLADAVAELAALMQLA